MGAAELRANTASYAASSSCSARIAFYVLQNALAQVDLSSLLPGERIREGASRWYRHLRQRIVCTFLALGRQMNEIKTARVGRVGPA